MPEEKSSALDLQTIRRSSRGLVFLWTCNTLQFTGWAFSFLIFFGLYLLYLRQAAPLVPYMDSIRLIWQLHDFLTGAMSLPDLWHQSGSVGLLFQLGTLFEWLFWGLDTRLTVFLTAGVWALLFGLYAKAWPSCCDQSTALESHGRRMAGLVAVQMLLGFYFFSPAGWEIWLLDLGFPQTLKNLIIAAYIYALSRVDYRDCTAGKLFLTGILGAAIILGIAYNWSYPFTATVLLVVVLSGGMISRNAYKGLLIVLPVLLAQLIYVRVSGSSLNSMAVKSDGHGLVNFLKALLYGVSSIFAGNETLSLLEIPPLILMVLGVLFVIAYFVILGFWLKFLMTQRSAIFFAALGIFGFCTLASIAVARGGQGYQFAAASRYFMDYQFIFVGFLGVTSCLLSVPQGMGKMKVAGIQINSEIWVRSILVAFGVLALVGQGATYLAEFKKAPNRALVYKAQSSVYLFGEASEKNAALLQTEITSLTKALAISDQFNLASLRNFAGKCRLDEALTSGDVYDFEEKGRWLGKNGRLVLGACPATFHIEGFLPAHVSSRILSLNVDGEEFQSPLTPGEGFFIAVKQKSIHNIVRLGFSLDHTHTPLAMGSSDTRELGAFITRIGP